MNDLISRQSVLDAIKKTHWFTVQADSNADYPCGTIDDIVSLTVHMDIDAVRRAVNDVPAASGWISVKDRLPPMEECVLVFCKGKSEHMQSVIKISEMSNINRFNYKCKTEPYWREPWDFFYANYDITHWMPLPEAPKEES